MINENSNLISISQFKNPNRFNITILSDNLDINGTKTKVVKKIQKDFSPTYYEFAIGSEEINGTININ